MLGALRRQAKARQCAVRSISDRISSEDFPLRENILPFPVPSSIPPLLTVGSTARSPTLRAYAFLNTSSLSPAGAAAGPDWFVYILDKPILSSYTGYEIQAQICSKLSVSQNC